MLLQDQYQLPPINGWRSSNLNAPNFGAPTSNDLVKTKIALTTLAALAAISGVMAFRYFARYLETI